MIQRIRRSRMFGWERNPLRRRIDRVEAGVLAGLTMVFLIGAPVLVAGAGHLARAAGLRALRTQATWSQVSATVPRAVPNQSESPWQLDTVLLQARWTAPDGQSRSGLIATSPGVVVGNTTRIWVSRSGSPTGAPAGAPNCWDGPRSPRWGRRLCWRSCSSSPSASSDGCSSGTASLAGTRHGEPRDRAGPASVNYRRARAHHPARVMQGMPCPGRVMSMTDHPAGWNH